MAHAHALYALRPLWQGLFWTSYFAWIGSEAWIFSRDGRAVSGVSADGGSRRFFVVMLGLGLFGGFFWANWTLVGRIPLHPSLLLSAGLALIWTGMALRLWAVRTLGRFFRTTVHVLDDHALVTGGPYRYVRNPSYTGMLITLAGVGLCLGNGISLSAILGFALIGCVRRIGVEDAALRERFGAAYDDYRRRSWALVPPMW
jgi:protein-S-isoprenylcysteine O-methyltransferase